MNRANERLAMHYIRKELRRQQQERRELARQEKERKEKKAKEELDFFVEYTMRMHGSMLCDRSYIKHITGPRRVWVPEYFNGWTPPPEPAPPTQQDLEHKARMAKLMEAMPPEEHSAVERIARELNAVLQSTPGELRPVTMAGKAYLEWEKREDELDRRKKEAVVNAEDIGSVIFKEETVNTEDVGSIIFKDEVEDICIPRMICQ